jgi:hypothetical protein
VDQQAAALNYLALLAGQKNHEEMQLYFLNQALSLLDARIFAPLRFQTLINRGHLHWDLRQFTAAQLDGEAALNLSERSLTRCFFARLPSFGKNPPRPTSTRPGNSHPILEHRPFDHLGKPDSTIEVGSGV